MVQVIEQSDKPVTHLCEPIQVLAPRPESWQNTYGTVHVNCVHVKYAQKAIVWPSLCIGPCSMISRLFCILWCNSQLIPGHGPQTQYLQVGQVMASDASHSGLMGLQVYGCRTHGRMVAMLDVWP